MASSKFTKLTRERPHSREHLVDGDGKRILIGGRHRLVAPDLGRHVRVGAHRNTGLRDRLVLWEGRNRVDNFGYAKVAQESIPACVEKDVVGLHVSMNQPGSMHDIQCITDRRKPLMQQ